VYSTRKHSPAGPRLRILLPLDRTASADEYEPLARKMAEYIGIDLCDPTTFEVSRLMYWPSCCSDSQYIYVWKDKPLLSANGLLAQYADWRDCTEWPQVPGAQNLPTKLAVKQGDPEAKAGVVGAFCRTCVSTILTAAERGGSARMRSTMQSLKRWPVICTLPP